MKLKKLFYVLFLILFLAGCYSSHKTDFEKYRYNPFQFPYPEYHYKAKIINVERIKNTFNEETQKVEFFGMVTNISKNLSANVEDLRKEGLPILFKTEDGNSFVMINKTKDTLMGCIYPEARKTNVDYCSAFGSTKEFFEKLYLLTPKDLSKPEYLPIGNSWIVHKKGYLFDNVEKIYIYESKKFKAFRRDFKPTNRSLKVELDIFPDKIAPDYITIATNIKDDKFILNLLKNLQEKCN